jgi:hypothetical protein
MVARARLWRSDAWMRSQSIECLALTLESASDSIDVDLTFLLLGG